MPKTYNLSERLLSFASNCISLSRELADCFEAVPLKLQFVRSCSSPALHYGEAQAAESRRDFIHKMRICLKELRETMNCLKLFQINGWVDGSILFKQLLEENNELIAIFVASIKTAEKGK